MILLLTTINGSWKLPIGYFLIVSLAREEKATFVRTAIQSRRWSKNHHCHLWWPAGNFSTFTILDCDVMREQTLTNFKSHYGKVRIFIDPCHAVKLVQNAFGELRLRWPNGSRNKLQIFGASSRFTRRGRSLLASY